MAQMANPLTNVEIPAGPGGATLENEELRQIIEKMTPEETPFYSNTRKGTTRALHTDWGTVSLPAITAAVAEKRGFEATILPSIPNIREQNWCELTAETGGVADSYNALDLAGRDDESDWQMLLKGQFLKRKVNKLMYTNQARSAAEPTTMATFPTWVSGSRFVSIATTPGTAADGHGGTVYTAGTGPQAFDSIDPVTDVMEACYATNGIPKIMYMSPNVKRQFSQLPDATIVQNNMNINPGQPNSLVFVGSVNVYWSDFGRLECAIDRDCPDSIIPMVDPDFLEVATLPGRQWKKTPLAKTGSSEKYMLEWEGTLRVWNPTAHGMIEGVAKV
jgi:hypothetical protein